MARSSPWFSGRKPTTEIVRVDAASRDSDIVASFGSWRDAGPLVEIVGPCPEASVPVGDCDADSEVTVEEIARSVSIALAGESVDLCPAIDQDGSDSATIEELIAAVRCALVGCG
ncbi:MAG: hypothetical protein N3C12_06920 [Candidatus Binatia bacterium]|nr:hypothetical protein [Candidatus Binatia bacterium]